MTYLSKLHGSSLRMGFFLLLGPQDFLVLIWSNAEVWKAELTSEPDSKWKISYIHIFTPRKQGKKSFICIAEFNLTGYEFVNRDKSLNFPDWILRCRDPFHDNVKNQRNVNQFLYLWNLNHCKADLTWICQWSLFMNTFNTESTTLFQQSWFPSYTLYWHFFCLKLYYK